MSSQIIRYRIGVSYYDSTLRQLYVLEVWDDGDKGFPVIDLGMISLLIIVVFEFSFRLCFAHLIFGFSSS